MAKIAFILLCHKDPEAIVAQAKLLTAAGDCIAIHFDARGGVDGYQTIVDGLAGNSNVTFAKTRIKCGWGEWSLVQASLYGLEAAVEAFPDATHFYMVSGDCASIKSAEYAHRFLDAHDRDYIESFDFFTSDWIKTGFKGERLIYRHHFNERTQKRLFYTSFQIQKRLGLERSIPEDLQIMIGSQWWCLRRSTIEAILAFLSKRRDVIRFFRTTWIPDETFFQTLVHHLVPQTEIETQTLTFLMFSDYGMPVTFFNDHYDLLLSQDFLFTRKISTEARELKNRLGKLWTSGQLDFAISNEGRRLFHFLTGRGRVGRRFAPRFWERESSLGLERELIMVVCKKWHVAKRLVTMAEHITGIVKLDYLFDEQACPLPHLGGLERTLSKRNRHRRALMRMLFDYYGTDRMMICLDPNNIDLIRDFDEDRCKTKVLEIDCTFDDVYLIGHARRVGLATTESPPEVIETMIPTLRYEFAFEFEQLREAGFAGHTRIRQDRPPESNAEMLSLLFDIPVQDALRLAQTPHLFAD